MNEIDPIDQKTLLNMRQAIAIEEQRKQKTILEGQNCFACYLDVDGFRERVRKQPKELYESYRQQRQWLISSFFRANAASHGGGNIELQHYDKLLWPYVFSDSWFFISTDNSPEALRQISTAAAGIMMRCWEIGFPAHGAIAEGPVWWNAEEQIALGNPIVDAYILAEKLNCFGVAIHPELSSRTTDCAFTAPICTPIKPSNWMEKILSPSENLRFACLKAHKTNRTWNTENYLLRYDKIAQDYEMQNNAKSHVVRRYHKSRSIFERMLIDEPANS
jgi:hypothetical protein